MKNVSPMISVSWSESSIFGPSSLFYLKISGGSTNNPNSISERYAFTAAYLSLTQDEERGRTVIAAYCEENKIPYWTGSTIEELLENIPEYSGVKNEMKALNK